MFEVYRENGKLQVKASPKKVIPEGVHVRQKSHNSWTDMFWAEDSEGQVLEFTMRWDADANKYEAPTLGHPQPWKPTPRAGVFGGYTLTPDLDD